MYFLISHPSSFPRFYELCWKSILLRCLSAPSLRLPDGFQVFKTVPPWYDPLELAKTKKNSNRTRSGEYGGFSCITMFFSARNCQILWVLWAGALFWWSINNVSCLNTLMTALALVSGSYKKIYVSSPVITLWSNSCLVVRCSMICWHTSMWRWFWSPIRSLGTIFAQMFRMSKSSMIILLIVIFHIHFTCDHPSSQLTIATHHLT